MPSVLSIEVESPDGDSWVLHGEGAGERGVYLGPRPEGIYSEPTTSIWNSHAFQTGADFGGIRVHKRDIVLGILTKETKHDTWQDNEDAFSAAFEFKRDSKLWIATDKTRRHLLTRKGENEQFVPDYDPFEDQFGALIFPLVAGYPRWLEPDVTAQWVSEVDTTNGVWNEGFIGVWNPTPLPMWLRYTVQAYPGAIWRLPDFSFGDDRYERADIDVDRVIVMPELIAGEHLRIDTNEEAEQVVSNIDTEIYQRMKGVTFCYPVQPKTGTKKNPIMLPVAVKNAAAGVGLQVRMPREYPHPWRMN